MRERDDVSLGAAVFAGAVLLVVFLTGCSTPLLRELAPASMADLDRVEEKVSDIPQVQYDAFIKAKAAGGDVGAAAEAAFKAGAERGEVKAAPEEGSIITSLLEIVAVILGGGATGTLITRVLRGSSLASGSGNGKESPEKPTAKKK